LREKTFIFLEYFFVIFTKGNNSTKKYGHFDLWKWFE